MTFMCFDIETVPQARFLESGSFEASESYWREVREAPLDAIEQTRRLQAGEIPLAATGVVPALHPTTCHIVQVSFGWRAPMGNHTAELHRRVLQSDAYSTESENVVSGVEATLVAHALGLVAAALAKGTRLVSFNGKSFDLPVLRARAALLRLNRAPINWRRLLYPYSDDQHADLRLILGADNRYAKGTLQWWAQAFGIHAEEHGAEVGGWVQAGEWDKLRAYGETEAQTLVELFEAVEVVL